MHFHVLQAFMVFVVDIICPWWLLYGHKHCIYTCFFYTSYAKRHMVYENKTNKKNNYNIKIMFNTDKNSIISKTVILLAIKYKVKERKVGETNHTGL